MDFDELDIPEDFIYDIASVPGSSDEVCQKAINHYKTIKSRPGLDSRLIEICDGIIGALTEYYSMASLGSSNLRQILPHLSENARFMESQTTVDVDVESSGRIKSFYSEYVKILDKITECVEKNEPIPTNGFLEDTWATRDVFHPRHDMKYNTQAFYAETYSLILDFMEHIEELSQEDSSYGFKEYDEQTLLNLKRPKKYSFPETETVVIPENDFLEYAFQSKKLAKGFKYLPSGITDIDELKNLIRDMKSNYDIRLEADNYPILNSVINDAKFEQLVAYRNDYEKMILDGMKDSKIVSSYESLPFDEFFEEHKRSFNSAQRDKLRFLNFLNEKIAKKDSNSFGVTLPKFENPTSNTSLTTELFNLATEQNKIIDERIGAIRNLDLDDNFEANYNESQKLKRFSRCMKDYMRSPKKTGYQSIHMIVQTPNGPYERQFRTAAQHHFAEQGPASHTNSYKPDVKSTFHRLKVTTPLSPKRDEHGDIIIPIELGLLPFELAVYNYYKQPFSNFSGGKNLAEFKEEHPNKEDFDRAMLALSPQKVSTNLMQKIWNKLFHKKKENYVPKVVTTTPTLTGTIYSDVPADISAYPNMPGTPAAPTTSSFSTDDSDPHGDR